MAKKFVRTNSEYFENNVNKDEYVNSIVFIEDTLQIWANNKYYAANIDWSNVLNPPIVSDGDGDKFLSDDGTYKSITAEAIKFSSNTQLKFYCVEPVTVVIGEDVTSIGDHAFENCKSLVAVKISDKVTRIGRRNSIGNFINMHR